jgi:hypothetical protein
MSHTGKHIETMPLDDYFDEVEGTSPSDKYVTARVLEEGGGMAVMVVNIGTFEESKKALTENFKELLADGKSIYMQSVEEFAENAETKQ